jgi:hypothetical protein
MVRYHHRKRIPRVGSAPAKLLLYAHQLHAEGMSVLEAATATFEGSGYANVSTYRAALYEIWPWMGLPMRNRSLAQRVRFQHKPPIPEFARHYRTDIRTEDLIAAYNECGTTSGAARIVGTTQQTAWNRLAKAGALRSAATVDSVREAGL